MLEETVSEVTCSYLDVHFRLVSEEKRPNMQNTKRIEEMEVVGAGNITGTLPSHSTTGQDFSLPRFCASCH